MKRIIFKLVFVFIITLIISIPIGLGLAQYMTMNSEYIQNETILTPQMFNLFMIVTIFIGFTVIFARFYIINITVLIITYNGTKKIENENIIYQRDLANDYNSAIASYILDGIIETKQDYKAVLVELEEMKMIYRENGKYRVNNELNNEKEELLLNQEIVLKQINEGRVNLREFKNAVKEDAKKLGYIKFNEKFIITLIVIMMIFPIAILGIGYILIVAIPYLNILTEKGKKEKDKILKLKKYLVNFSNIQDLKTSDNNIWGEYLAYAISLNVNKQLKVKQINFNT